MGGFSGLKRILFWLFKQLFPPACPLCSRTLPIDWSDIFCADCLAGFRPVPEAHCPRCALPFAGAATTPHLCGRCTSQPPAYVRIYSVGLYEQSVRRAIHQFKFNQKISLDRPLGTLLEQAIDADLELDLVIPVPLHRKRLQQRSYNQALLLAREFARIRKLNVATDLLIKVRETPPQQGLTAREREKNLQGSFELQAGINGKRVLLVDDVMTTGATVSACSRLLMAGGAAAVSVGVIGRAAR